MDVPETTPTPANTPRPVVPTSNPSSGGGIYSGSGINRPVHNQEQTAGFTDIAGHWAEADIKEMAQRGIVAGITASMFAPDQEITRAEFAAIVVRALGISAAAGSVEFEDVAQDSWYAGPVMAAAAAGLITGYEGEFRPDDLITREEMAVVIVKAYQYLGKETSRGGISKFSDREEISLWAEEYVDQAASAELISGVSATRFAPHENATRAQVASLVKRLLNV